MRHLNVLRAARALDAAYSAANSGMQDTTDAETDKLVAAEQDLAAEPAYCLEDVMLKIRAVEREGRLDAVEEIIYSIFADIKRLAFA